MTVTLLCSPNWIAIGALMASVAAAQSPEQRLTPIPQPAPADFGDNVSMNARHLIVGDPQSDFLCGGATPCTGGLVYAYRPGARGQWELAQAILPSDAGLNFAFGASVALTGDRMVVGAPGSDLVWPGAGAAYVFEFSGEQWVEVGRFGEPLPITDNEFASTVAMWGDVILASNYVEVFLFRKKAEGWTYVETIRSPLPGGSASAFGSSMVLDEEWLIIGDALDSTMGSQAGAVHVYRWGGDGRPDYQYSLHAPDPTTGRRFGGVTLYQNLLVVGATNAKHAGVVTGAAFVHELIGGRWVLTQRIDPPDRDDILFGAGITIEGDTMAIGAPGDRSFDQWGSVRMYQRDREGEWFQTLQVRPELPASRFGGPKALYDGSLAVGAPGTRIGGVDQGSVHVFELAYLFCPPDLDIDGALTVFDFLTFLNLFQDGDPIADFDGDGELTIFDFLAFQAAFDAGCE